MILSPIFAAAELNYSKSTWILSLEFYAEKINCVPGVGVALKEITEPNFPCIWNKWKNVKAGW